MKENPITLVGRKVRLEPLSMEHTVALFQISQHPQLWSYTPYNPSYSLAHMASWIEDALRAQENGIQLPFTIFDQQTNMVLGSTRYRDISAQHRSLEIGSTWIIPNAQGTGVNTECKYLLFRHAFETLGIIRLVLQTHLNNVRAQQAIEKLGATKEGILRNHMIMPDGSYRHSVYYSIIDREWPVVKLQIEARLAQQIDVNK